MVTKDYSQLERGYVIEAADIELQLFRLCAYLLAPSGINIQAPETGEDAVRLIYERYASREISILLLTIAASVRTLFDQRPTLDRTNRLCGPRLSLYEACNKIVHATKIVQPPKSISSPVAIFIYGKARDETDWKHSLGVTEFVRAVLQLLDEVSG